VCVADDVYVGRFRLIFVIIKDFSVEIILDRDKKEVKFNDVSKLNVFTDSRLKELET
jgi:hypothetical protein